MKFSKELSTGFFAIFAIALLIAGVNFLKGSSFFGGDDVYYAYFPNSAGVTSATSVQFNGVNVGKVLNVENTYSTDSSRQVKITFNIQDRSFKIPLKSEIEAGALESDLLGKGLTIHPPRTANTGFYKSGDEIQGIVSMSITNQIKDYADPVLKKVNFVLTSIDDVATRLAAFWDTTASSEMEQSMIEVKLAIRKFGDAAEQVSSLVENEQIRFRRIMANVLDITANLKKSNDTVKAIVGNVKRITDDMVTTDFTGVVENAKNTLATLNQTLDAANKGEGTLGKLLGDDALYNNLVETNKQLQNLINDLTVHPERYIHMSIFGAKTKGAPLTNQEEKKLKELLKSLPNP